MKEIDTLIQDIEKSLREALHVSYLHIEDESHLHVSHPQRPKDKYHLSLTLMSDDFENCSRVAQHKMIYKILDPFLKTKVHALKIRSGKEAQHAKDPNITQ